MKFAWLILFSSLIFSKDYLQVKPQKGDGVGKLFNRYNLIVNKENINFFFDNNQGKFTQNDGLILSKSYYLPIKKYKFNGKSIRTTISNNDYDYALSLQIYNESLTAKGIKKEDFRKNLELWVPVGKFITNSKNQAVAKPKSLLKNKKLPILGKKEESFKEISKKLEGVNFYLISGHGGPDPGANIRKNGNLLCEDEYAYDVVLRLGKKLEEHGAKVHFIVQDPNDGIRNTEVLKQDKDEFYLGGVEIALNQRNRLRKRVEIVNNLTNSKPSEKHHAISIHVDSRIKKNQQIDIFFYHHSASSKGKKIANQLLKTITQKYKKAQPNRGYKGTVSTRDELFVVRKTKPVVTFIELGNIKNARDQRRILVSDNRQAIANWLCDGLLEAYK